MQIPSRYCTIPYTYQITLKTQNKYRTYIVKIPYTYNTNPVYTYRTNTEQMPYTYRTHIVHLLSKPRTHTIQTPYENHIKRLVPHISCQELGTKHVVAFCRIKYLVPSAWYQNLAQSICKYLYIYISYTIHMYICALVHMYIKCI